MKTLIVNGEIFTAEKIIKTDTDIIGYTNGKREFIFRGINDFNSFKLEEGQEWDISEKEHQEAIIAGLAYELVQKDLAIQTLEATQAEVIYQLMIKGVL